MARLIEIDGPFTGKINLRTGDILKLSASGGDIISGNEVLELLGPFSPGIVVKGDEIIEPAGSPNTVMFLARKPGIAKIRSFWGDAWNMPASMENIITVDEKIF